MGTPLSTAVTVIRQLDTERTTELFCHIVNRWKSLGGWPLATPEDVPADDNPQ